MLGLSVVLFAAFGTSLAAIAASTTTVLFDFTQPRADSVESFHEVSDTTRDVGMSKAVISIVESEAVRHAVFFSLLNPQENSACFAGVQSDFGVSSDWASYAAVEINLRAQGQFNVFKVVIKDTQSQSNSSLAFESFFETDIESLSFETVRVPMTNLKCSYRGKACQEQILISQITSFGLQAAGGVYESFTQQGAASLEINTISITA
jgi:hypothetical protein